MKVIYEFEPDDEKNNDEYELKLIQRASDMFGALCDLDSLKRNLYKGYKYYPPEPENIIDENESPYSKVNIDDLIDDLGQILEDAKYYEIS